jgi:hypothetical protein
MAPLIKQVAKGEKQLGRSFEFFFIMPVQRIPRYK